MIRFECSHCRNAIAVPEERAGRVGKCSRCGNRVAVPELATAAASVAATPAADALVIDDHAVTAAELPIVARPSAVRRQRSRASDIFFMGLLLGLAGAAGTAIWMRIDQLNREPPPKTIDNSQGSSGSAHQHDKPIRGTGSGESDSKSGGGGTGDFGTTKIVEYKTPEETPPDPVGAEPLPVFPAIKPAKLDRDETVEGREAIRKIEDRAKEIYRDRDRIEVYEKRPLQIPHDQLVGEVEQLQQANNEAKMQIMQLNGANQLLLQQKNATMDLGQRRMFDDQMTANNQGIANLQQGIQINVGAINMRTPRIKALEASLVPINTKLQKLWVQLVAARAQWLEQHELYEKYARGDYELLHEVLNAWLLIDGLWPEAHCWSALCAYERGELRQAQADCAKAKELYKEYVDSSKPNAQIRALEGLIRMKQEGPSAKAKDALSDAEKLANKKKVKDWEPYFLIGRSWADRPGELDQRKALGKLNDVLKRDPQNRCAEVWIARLQTTTKHEKLRNLEAGTATLARHWKATGERSWRLAVDLAKAYRAAGKTAECDVYFESALKLAPENSREEIERIRAEDETSNSGRK